MPIARFLILRLLLLAGVYSTCLTPPTLMASSPVPVILDTDFRTDCDDAGALGMLHALADLGEAQLLGVVASTTGPHVVAAIDAVNTYYGRGGLPVGVSPRAAEPEGDAGDGYAPTLADTRKFPSTLTNETAPDSTALYRRLLHAAADGSVKIIVVGGQSCIALLLASGADYEGDGSISKTGRELIKAKVKELVVMGGNFQHKHQWEFNIGLDVKAADMVAREWPGPVVYTGYEVGINVQTGGNLQDPEQNPVAMAYKLSKHTVGGAGKIGWRHSWDQTAVYYAVRGLGDADAPLWKLSQPIDLQFQGKTIFKVAETAPPREQLRRYFIEVAPKAEAAARIEELMLRKPRG